MVPENPLTRDDTITIYNESSQELETYNVHSGELIAHGRDIIGKDDLQPTAELLEAIENMVREGKSLPKIAELPSMPSIHVIYRWKRRFPAFNKGIKEAREDRADWHMEQAEEQINEAFDKDSVNVAKFKFDSYLKLAERGNQRDYLPKTKSEEDGKGNVQIVVNTGIKRDEDFIEVKNGQEEKETSQNSLEEESGHGGSYTSVKINELEDQTDAGDSQTEHPKRNPREGLSSNLDEDPEKVQEAEEKLEKGEF